MVLMDRQAMEKASCQAFSASVVPTIFYSPVPETWNTKASLFKMNLPPSVPKRFVFQNLSQTENCTRLQFKSLCWEKLNIISG